MERIELSTLAILAVILFFLGWWFKGWARRLRQQMENGEAVEPTEVTVLQAPPPVSLPTPAQVSQEPDGPVPFGYKTTWMALRCDDPERVISALRPRLRQSANWTTGLAAVEAQMERRVFVSPALEGWVLAVGGPETLQEELTVQFPQAQRFMSHRTSGCFGWALYENGRCRRRYACLDGQVESVGELTPQERALGFDRFPTPENADTCETLPDEEDVLNIAAAWGVDPRFEKTAYPPSAGWVCGL